MQKSIFLISFGLFLASGCTSMSVDDFKETGPALILENYFDGETQAWGLFEDRTGTVRRQFVVEISGRWDGTTLILDEDFRYSDGAKENRLWTITKTGPNDYVGETAEAVGPAVGKTAGNAFRWEYDFNLKVGDSAWKVHFDDWLFLQPNGVLLNKATVSRWGIKIGTVFLSFRKLPPAGKSRLPDVRPESELEPA